MGKEGVSLIELMVVISIIGILAAVAIPSYNNYREKVYEAEAKTNLSALFQAEQIYYLSYSGYSNNLVALGFYPRGTYSYNCGFIDSFIYGPNDTNVGSYADEYKTTYDMCDSTNYNCNVPDFGSLMGDFGGISANTFIAQCHRHGRLNGMRWHLELQVNENKVITKKLDEAL